MDFTNRMYRSPEDSIELGGLSSEGHSTTQIQVPSTAPIIPVVLSGGSGSRLWPYSTEDTPKQFLSFTGAKSLFQLTLERVRDRRRFASPIVVANIRHAELCDRELAEEIDAQLILEPFARNTAAAIAMAAVAAKQSHGEDALLLVMPSDHVLEDMAAFHAGIRAAEAAARSGYLVTFGIRPTGPDTGFGYIKVGDELAENRDVREVSRFVEKPPLESAEQMIADGKHLWNAGIFLFRAGTFLDEVMLHAPEIGSAALQAVVSGQRCGNRIIGDKDALEACPSESVDCAVMEHSRRLVVVPMAPGWSDLGSWDALAELLEASSHGPITALDCDDCYIRSDGVQVAALGVRDLIIVASGQRLLILPRGRSQEVKKLLSAMESMAA
ncbi:MAG TPA: sugar phosphate nucleotidyltransferase [Sphingomicrobium sp.]|nr:sugar phosphate nucleotidyltransferase [Sphingomicrobium sp.]